MRRLEVEAQLRWLWVVVSEQVTFCDICRAQLRTGRCTVGADYNGWLTHDGWRCTTSFSKPAIKAAPSICFVGPRHGPGSLSGAACFPRRVHALLEEGLALRDRYKNQEISLHGLWTATGGWKPSWSVCWRVPIEIRPTAGWPNICNTSGLTSLPIFIVPAWMRPTMWPSEPSEL